VDPNRISLLVAVLSKRIGVELGDQDIFVNVAGGLKIEEPAADLGVVSALMSSFLDRPVDKGLVVFGEVGLSGEIRGVNQPGLRINEARKLGFSRCLMSKSNLETCASPDSRNRTGDIELAGVGSVKDLLDVLF